MRTLPAILHVALCLSSLSPIVSAWPGWLPERDALYVRQNDEESESATQGSTASRDTSEATRTTEAPSGTATDNDSDEDEDEDTDRTTTVRDQNTAVPQTGTNTRSPGSQPTRTIFDPAGYPGGVEMIEPDTTRIATALYKIGDNVEFAWNYTSLQATPTAVDVLVSCSAASETWTLTANMTFETEVSFIWETEEQADDVDAPLLTEMYTLIIKDVEAEVTERPEAGYLGAFSGFTFGLYRPAAYTPNSEWECTTCNAGVGGFDGQAIKFAATMALVSFCSFTWFVTGLGA